MSFPFIASVETVDTQNLTPPGAKICHGEVVPQHLIPSNISKSAQLTLDQFDNNYRLFCKGLKMTTLI